MGNTESNVHLCFGPKPVLVFTWFRGIRAFAPNRKGAHVNALLEGVYMMSFRPKRGGNGSLASIEISQFIYMRPSVSAEPSSSVLMAEALPFVSGVAAM